MKLYNIYISEGLRQNPRRGEEGQPDFIFNYTLDTGDDIILLANPDPARTLDVSGLTCYAAFAPAARLVKKKEERKELAAQRLRKRETPNDEEISELRRTVDFVKRASSPSAALQVMANKPVLQNIDRFISLAAVAGRRSVSRSSGETVQTLERFEGLNEASKDFIEQIKSFIGNRSLSEFDNMGNAQKARILSSAVEYSGLDELTTDTLAAQLDSLATNLEDIRDTYSDVDGRNQELQGGIESIRGTEKAIEEAYIELGRYIGANADTDDIKNFIGLGVKLLKEAFNTSEVAYAIPVPSRQGRYNQTVANLLEGLGVQVLDVIGRTNFSINIEKLTEIARKSKKWPTMELSDTRVKFISGEEAADMIRRGQLDQLNAQPLKSGRGRANYKTSLASFIDRFQDPNRPTSISGIDIKYREIVDGGYALNSEEALVEVVDAVDSGKKIMLVDDNVFSGHTMKLCADSLIKSIGDQATMFNTNFDPNQVFGAVLLTNRAN